MVMLDGTYDSAGRKPIMSFQHSEGKRPLRTMEICFALRRGDNLSELFVDWRSNGLRLSSFFVEMSSFNKLKHIEGWA
jgi:hypothetical protein